MVDKEKQPRTLEALIDKAAEIAAPVFEAQEWMWGGWFDNPGHVPTKAEIVETLQHLVNSVQDPQVDNAATGRFVVQKIHENERDQTDGICILLDLGSFYFYR